MHSPLIQVLRIHLCRASLGHFCDLEPEHEGKHRCMNCKVEFGR
jgi:hypothetical protein